MRKLFFVLVITIFTLMLLLLNQKSAFSDDESKNRPISVTNHLADLTVIPWAVGQSVAYENKEFKNGVLIGESTKIYSIVGAEKVGSVDYLWFEISKGTPKSLPSYVQFLVPPQTTGTLTDFVLNENLDALMPVAIVKQNGGSEEPIEAAVSKGLEEGIRAALKKVRTDFYKVFTSFKETQNQQFSTPAGSFKGVKFTRMFKGEIISLWFSPNVPLGGVVKISEGFTDPQKNKWAKELTLTTLQLTGSRLKIHQQPSYITESDAAQRGFPLKTLFGY